MEFEKIMELIHAVSDSNLTQFQIQDGDLKLSMKTNKETKLAAIPMAAPASASMEEEKSPQAKGSAVKSPLVGIYYQASSPECAPFIKVGDAVKKGQILGIVEAMKLMNEIESEVDGTVKEILVENEQLVEYGQPMFVIG